MNGEKRFFVSFSVHICMFVCACKYEDDDDFREDDHDDHDSHDDGNDYGADDHVGHDDVDQVLTCDLSTRTPLETAGHQAQHKSTPVPKVIMGVVIIIGEQTVINVISTTKITTNHMLMKVTTKAPGQE